MVKVDFGMALHRKPPATGNWREVILLAEEIPKPQQAALIRQGVRRRKVVGENSNIPYYALYASGPDRDRLEGIEAGMAMAVRGGATKFHRAVALSQALRQTERDLFQRFAERGE